MNIQYENKMNAFFKKSWKGGISATLIISNTVMTAKATPVAKYQKSHWNKMLGKNTKTVSTLNHFFVFVEKPSSSVNDFQDTTQIIATTRPTSKSNKKIFLSLEL